MEYLDALRGDGWIPDPGDRVAVIAEHENHCQAPSGGPCRCLPRLVLRESTDESVFGAGAASRTRSAGSARAS